MRYLANIERGLMLIIFPIMCILIFVMTLSRIFGIGTDYMVWAEEASRYLMIWMAFLAVVSAARSSSHFRMGAVVDNLPPKFSKLIKTLANLLTIAIMIILLYHGYRLLNRQIASGQTSPVLNIPIWIPYLAIPVGMLGLLAHTVIHQIRLLRAPTTVPEENMPSEKEPT